MNLRVRAYRRGDGTVVRSYLREDRGIGRGRFRKLIPGHFVTVDEFDQFVEPKRRG